MVLLLLMLFFPLRMTLETSRMKELLLIGCLLATVTSSMVNALHSDTVENKIRDNADLSQVATHTDTLLLYNIPIPVYIQFCFICIAQHSLVCVPRDAHS